MVLDAVGRLELQAHERVAGRPRFNELRESIKAFLASFLASIVIGGDASKRLLSTSISELERVLRGLSPHMDLEGAIDSMGDVRLDLETLISFVGPRTLMRALEESIAILLGASEVGVGYDLEPIRAVARAAGWKLDPEEMGPVAASTATILTVVSSLEASLLAAHAS